MTQIHEFGPTGRHMRGQSRLDDRGEERPLVGLVGLAAKEAVFESSTIAMFGAMKIHENVAHDHFTGVVQSLSKVFLPIGVLGFVVGRNRDDLGFGAHGSPVVKVERLLLVLVILAVRRW
jgi:hypothetical protein